MVFTASLLGVQHKRDRVGNKRASCPWATHWQTGDELSSLPVVVAQSNWRLAKKDKWESRDLRSFSKNLRSSHTKKKIAELASRRNSNLNTSPQCLLKRGRKWKWLVVSAQNVTLYVGFPSTIVVCNLIVLVRVVLDRLQWKARGCSAVSRLYVS